MDLPTFSSLTSSVQGNSLFGTILSFLKQIVGWINSSAIFLNQNFLTNIPIWGILLIYGGILAGLYDYYVGKKSWDLIIRRGKTALITKALIFFAIFTFVK